MNHFNDCVIVPPPSMFQFINVDNAIQRERITRILDIQLRAAGLDIGKLVKEMEAETPVDHPELHHFVTELIYEVNRAGQLVQILQRASGHYILLCRGRIVEVLTTAGRKMVLRFANEPKTSAPNPEVPDPQECEIADPRNNHMAHLFHCANNWLMDGTALQKFCA